MPVILDDYGSLQQDPARGGRVRGRERAARYRRLAGGCGVHRLSDMTVRGCGNAQAAGLLLLGTATDSSGPGGGTPLVRSSRSLDSSRLSDLLAACRRQQPRAHDDAFSSSVGRLCAAGVLLSQHARSSPPPIPRSRPRSGARESGRPEGAHGTAARWLGAPRSGNASTIEPRKLRRGGPPENLPQLNPTDGRDGSGRAPAVFSHWVFAALCPTTAHPLSRRDTGRDVLKSRSASNEKVSLPIR